MVLLKDYEAGAMKVLLLGPSGSGKTCLALTLGERAVVLDLNNGLVAPKTFKDRFFKERQEVDVKRCWGPGGPSAMWGKTKGFVTSFVAKPPRGALVIDGLSDLLEASLGDVLAKSGKWDAAQSATQSEWGVAISQVERLLWKVKSVNAVVVVVAHTKFVERNKVMKEVLACFGTTLPGKIMALFDEAWYTRVTGFGDKRKWVLQSQSSAEVECKTRRQLPERSEMNLGLPRLMKMVGWKWEEKEEKEEKAK